MLVQFFRNIAETQAHAHTQRDTALPHERGSTANTVVFTAMCVYFSHTKTRSAELEIKRIS